MTRAAAALAAAALALAACSSDGATPPPRATPPRPIEEADVVLPVIASRSGPSSVVDRTYLDGMALALRRVNAGREGGPSIALEVTDDRGDPAATRSLLRDALGERPPAVLVADPGGAVAGARRAIERSGVPVFLLGGDLYTSRELFRLVFQTGVPLRWQVRVIARHLAGDLGHERVALAAAGVRDFETVVSEMRAEGADPSVIRARQPQAVARAAGDAQALVYLGSPDDAPRIARALSRLPDPPLLAVTADALSADHSFAPGTVAPYAYTWGGWAEPIRRVSRFRRQMDRVFGHPPRSLEQEGHDAVRALVDALEDGADLVSALESFRPEGKTYSSLPVILGPDDHIVADDGQLGLFAVAGPAEGEPWLSGSSPWRPIMRTFTTDGERVNLLDEDRRVFFPSWRADRPGPKYFRSRYGIVTRF